MKRTYCNTLSLAAFLALTGSFAFAREASPGDPDPTRFEDDIERFEESDRLKAPPEGAVLCIGSSSMRMWHDRIREDLSPLTLITRGFGGSTMNDLLHYTDRIVLPYQPRAIVVYEGDNDVAQGVTPAVIKETFRAFVGKVHADLPECRIYLLSIKPSISRWTMWPDMQEANRLLATDCAGDERLTFVDIGAGMLDDSGTPRKKLFKADDLHMNRAGYELWREVIKPVLHEGELPFEKLVVRQREQSFETEVRVKTRTEYLLYVPEAYDESEQSWPLMLFLHGAGERGDDLSKVAVHGPPRLAGEGNEFPFILVSPQCPERDWWTSGLQLATLNALLDDLVSHYRIDENRIYLTGLSMGGFGTFSLADAYPERFAAIAPVCGGGDPKQAAGIAHIPAWVFHGGQDKVVPVSRSQDMVDALKANAAKVEFTVYPEAGHDSWTETYDTPELYDWLLSHQREEPVENRDP